MTPYGPTLPSAANGENQREGREALPHRHHSIADKRQNRISRTYTHTQRQLYCASKVRCRDFSPIWMTSGTSPLPAVGDKGQLGSGEGNLSLAHVTAQQNVSGPALSYLPVNFIMLQLMRARVISPALMPPGQLSRGAQVRYGANSAQLSGINISLVYSPDKEHLPGCCCRDMHQDLAPNVSTSQDPTLVLGGITIYSHQATFFSNP